MPSINGIGSGLDIESLIEASLIQRRTSIQVLEGKKALLSARQGAFIGLKSKLSSFKSAAEGITGLMSTLMSGSSSSEAVGISATSKASIGSHEVVVHTLAQAHRLGAQGFVDKSSTSVSAGVGTLEVRVGDGAMVEVDVDATTTLQELADAINDEDGDVTASIINDGSAVNPYRMVLSAKNAGTEEVISIVNNDTTLDFSNKTFEQPAANGANSGDYAGTVTTSGAYTGSDSRAYLVDIMTEGAAGVATYRVSLDGGVTWDDNSGSGYTTGTAPAALGSAATAAGLQVDFTDSGTLRVGDKFTFDAFNPTLREPRNAFAVVDGVSVQSTTNTVTDAIGGVTLTLTEADPTETIDVSVSRSDSDITSKVGDFIKAYNDLVGGIRADQTYDSETKSAGHLLGDQVANRIVYEISSALSQAVDGASGTFATLSELGIEVDADGVLSLDAAQLEDALAEDATSVLEVLEGATTSSTTEIEALTTPSTVPAGTYSVNITQAAAKAQVDALAAMSGPLSANETLDFSYTMNATDDTPDLTVFQVTLQSGRTLTQLIADLNDAFKAEGVAMTASDNGGSLRIETDGYGAANEFTVFSDRSGAGSTEIGTSSQKDTGVDIAGTIGGSIGEGIGAQLTAAGGATDGLEIKYEGASTGVIGTMSVVQGAASLFAALAQSLGEDDDSPVSARDEGLQSEIDLIDARIVERQRLLSLTEKRVRAQFTALDAALGKMKLQGDAMLTSLLATVGQS